MCWLCGAAIYLWVGMLIVTTFENAIEELEHPKITRLALCFVWPISVYCVLRDYLKRE